MKRIYVAFVNIMAQSTPFVQLSHIPLPHLPELISSFKDQPLLKRREKDKKKEIFLLLTMMNCRVMDTHVVLCCTCVIFRTISEVASEFSFTNFHFILFQVITVISGKVFAKTLV